MTSLTQDRRSAQSRLDDYRTDLEMALGNEMLTRNRVAALEALALSMGAPGLRGFLFRLRFLFLGHPRKEVLTDSAR